jgi:hypothetical protein
METERIDWHLTTWRGAQEEQLRRWAELPLEQIILAQEEMQLLADQLASAPGGPSTRSAPDSSASR